MMEKTRKFPRRTPDRPHVWIDGGIKNSNPVVVCSRKDCDTTWWPWQTEIQKGNCRGESK